MELYVFGQKNCGRSLVFVTLHDIFASLLWTFRASNVAGTWLAGGHYLFGIK